MEFVLTTTLLVIILALTFVHFLTHNDKRGRAINKIPGPKGLPIIGNTLDICIPREALWIWLRKHAREYYPIYKAWVAHMPVVGLQHPDDAEALLSSQKNISKSMFYDFLHPWLEEGLLTSTGDKWRGRRKILTPAFHFNMLQEFVGAFVENSERMVKTLKAERGEVVKEVIPFFAKFTLSAICDQVWRLNSDYSFCCRPSNIDAGLNTISWENTRSADYIFALYSLNKLIVAKNNTSGRFSYPTCTYDDLIDEDPAQGEYRNAVKAMGDIFYYRAVRPWYKVDWIFSLSPGGRKQKAALEILHHFTTKIINERKEYHDKTGGKYIGHITSENGISNATDDDLPKKKRLAMLDLLIAVQKENREKIDNRGIREEVDTFIFEGHDTTVMALNFAVALLAEHKEIQARARAEIDDVLKGSGEKLGMSEMQNLTYLDRCIKEAMRLYPPVPSISRRITEELKLKNYVIPTGCMVNLSIFEVHRDPNFWPEPEVFDPDRFLPDRTKNRHPYSYIPFSGGPRNCIGQKFALLEMKAFIGLLLHNFILEPVDPLSGVRMLPDLVLKLANPFHVRFVPIRK